MLSVICQVLCGTVPALADIQKPAVSFSQLNDDNVFLKQTQSGTCTLTAAAMMIRRAAMLSGNGDWQKITGQSIRKTAWLEGTGLKWDFTVFGITVAHKALSSKKELISLLEKHPEGIVIYNTGEPHAILATDYTGGIFYGADSSAAVPPGRIPVSQASITVESATVCWYVTNPTGLTVMRDNAGNLAQEPTGDAEENVQEPADDLKENVPKPQEPQEPQTSNTGTLADFKAVYEAGGMTYRILSAKNRTVACTGRTGNGTSVTIPDTVVLKGEKYKVTRITGGAFARSAELQKVTVGAHVSVIGNKVFYKCKNLKKIIIRAAELQKIGADTFAGIYEKAKFYVGGQDQKKAFTKLLAGTSVPAAVQITVSPAAALPDNGFVKSEQKDVSGKNKAKMNISSVFKKG